MKTGRYFYFIVKLVADTQLRENRKLQDYRTGFSIISNRTMGRNKETFMFKVNVLLHVYITLKLHIYKFT